MELLMLGHFISKKQYWFQRWISADVELTENIKITSIKWFDYMFVVSPAPMPLWYYDNGIYTPRI